MGKLWTEEKVLKKLNIEDFRHLNKEKAIEMASMLDKMDPEVAKKALEQFPEFSKTISDMLKDYKDTLDKGMADNKESVQNYYDMCKSTIEVLQGMLKNEDLSFEEKKYIIEQIKDIQEKVSEKDSENKRFIAAVLAIGAIVVTTTVKVAASAIGSSVTNGATDDWPEHKI